MFFCFIVTNKITHLATSDIDSPLTEQELSSIQLEEFPRPCPRPLPRPLPLPRGFWIDGSGHDGLEKSSAVFFVLFLEPRGLPLPLFCGWSWTEGGAG